MKAPETVASLRQKDDKRSETYVSCRKNNTCYLHYHEGIEMVYNQKGTMQATVDGINYNVCAGQLLLCSGYNAHCYNTADTSDVIILMIPLDFVPEIRTIMHGRRFKKVLITQPMPEVVSCIQYMARFAVEKKTERTILTREKIRAMSYFVLYTMIETIGYEDYILMDKQKVVYKIMDFIQNNYMHPVTLKDLAQATNYSIGRLSHLFKEYFQCTFMQYLNSQRCKHAVHLLWRNEMSGLELSEACGYENLRSFYRAFKRIYGLSPLQYITQERQRLNKGSNENA